MGTWMIRWNFNAANYSPGQCAEFNVWLENTGDTWIHLSNFRLIFDFGIYNLTSVAGQVGPRATAFLGSVKLNLPPNEVGQKLFSFDYSIQEYVGNYWVNIGSYSSDRQYFISVYPQPLYTVFLSRGLHLEDRVTGDPLAEMIREWGLDTVTVGIEVQVTEEQVAQAVKQEIATSDGLIAIATPRSLDALSGLWRTLEWHHGEVGIAYGVDKPLLILRDRRVTLSGLPSYLNASGQVPVLELDPYNVEELKHRLAAVMPGFRGWLETHRKRDFFDSLSKLAIGGLAVVGAVTVLAGIFGASGGQSKK
ncbi:hypothetical protein ES703_101001 [subsurface metagenome]